MGMLRSPILIRAAKRIELWFYRRAAAVLALTDGIRKGILADGIAPSKVLLFRNSVDCDFFRPGLASEKMRQELQIGERDYVILYAGTLGLAHNLSVVLQTAAIFQREKMESVRFVLVGEGAESDRLRADARSRGLTNVAFFSSLPKKRMPELLNAADCIVVPLRKLEVFRGALPTKMFEAMACGKPVILSIEGEAEDLLREAGGGYCVPPDDPTALHHAVLSAMQSRQEAIRRGLNGREYVVQHFSRDTRAGELHAIVCNVLGAAAFSRFAVTRMQSAEETSVLHANSPTEGIREPAGR